MSNIKVQLFTHTDLDGVGCAILAYLAFGRKNVDVEYCDYNNINDEVRNYLIHESLYDYDKIFVTDISIMDEVAKEIDSYNMDGKWRLFDHHASANDLNKYWWCTVDTMNDSLDIKTSGTELFL
jgi:oligoribonuclease NrnB/cAMP/cGMP phosphodiesterase (DHH superfamily)